MASKDTRRVTVVFGSETSGAEQGFKRVGAESEKLGGKTGKLDELFGKLGPGILASLGAESVMTVFNKVISGASDLNETVSKTQQVFKTTSGAVIRWSDTASSSMGLSKRAALDNASAFGNMFEQIGITESVAEKMSLRMVQLASDFASFHNANPEDVMDALQSATRGEYDALQRFVPTVNAATIQTEAMAEAHKKTAAALTEADKATALYNLVLKNAGAATGDFQRTSNSAANQQRILSATLEDSAAKIGQAVLPAYQGMLNLINKLGPLKLVVLGLAIAFGTQITAALTKATLGFTVYIGKLRAAAIASSGAATSTSRLGRALTTTGAIATNTGTKMTGMVRNMSLITKVAAVIGIAQLVTAGFAKEMNIQIDALTNRLKEYGDTGRVSGEATKVFGDNMKYVRSEVNFIRQGFGDKLGKSVGSFFEDISGLSDAADVSIAHTKLRIDAMDASLSSLVQNGHADDAKAAFDRLSAALVAQGASVSEVRKAFPQYADELELVASQNDTASTVVDTFAKQLKTLAPAFQGTLTDAKGFQDALGTLGKAGENAQSQLFEYRAILGGVANSQLTATEKGKLFGDGLTAIENSVAPLTDKGKALAGVFNQIAGAQIGAKQKGDLLKTTMDQLYGAARQQIETGDSQITTVAAFTGELKKNGQVFDLNKAKTEKSRTATLANRDALVAALKATQDKYLADIIAGENADTARGKYNKQSGAILAQISPTQRNTGAVKDLVNAYGKIPPKKTTAIGLTGDKVALTALIKSFALQKALASNWTKAQADSYYSSTLRQYLNPGFVGPVAPQILGTGGTVGGHSPHKSADNIAAWLTAREYVHPVDTVDYYGVNTMEAIRKKQISPSLLKSAATGDLPEMYADGGLVTGGPKWPFNIKEQIKNPVNLAALQKQFADMLASRAMGGTAVGDIGVARIAEATARGMKASDKQLLSLIEAGIVESGMRNISFGDRDSVGFLQQRAGWGSIAQRMDVAHATHSFISAAKSKDRGKAQTSGQLAQAVQQSAFPARYAAEEANAYAILNKEAPFISGGGAAGSGGGAFVPGYRNQIATIDRAGFNFHPSVGQTYGGVHAPNSWHYRGRAIDLSPPTNKAWDWLVANYAKTSQELFWRSKNPNYRHGQAIGPMDKTNHIHWAYDDGGVLPPGTTVAHNNTGRNEYVRTEAQLANGAPNVVVNVTVQGNVTAEKALAESIATEVRNALLRKAARNGGKTGLV